MWVDFFALRSTPVVLEVLLKTNPKALCHPICRFLHSRSPAYLFGDQFLALSQGLNVFLQAQQLAGQAAPLPRRVLAHGEKNVNVGDAIGGETTTHIL